MLLPNLQNMKKIKLFVELYDAKTAITVGEHGQ